MIIRIIFALLFLLPNIAYAKINILVSISPIASLVAMIAGNMADVSVIAKTDSCPHHYALKPSDLKNAVKADLFVYIDDDFDAFAKLLLSKSKAKVLKISDIKELKLIPHNWHLWLLPENARLILKAAEKVLSAMSPDNADLFKDNLKISLPQIDQLEERRKAAITEGSRIALLTDSAEYLFIDTHVTLNKLYQSSDYPSIKMLDRLKNVDKAACFIISTEQNEIKFKNLLGLEHTIIQLATENWGDSLDLEVLYFREYGTILESLKYCKNTTY